MAVPGYVRTMLMGVLLAGLSLLGPADVALVYFAGHGMALGGEQITLILATKFFRTSSLFLQVIVQEIRFFYSGLGIAIILRRPIYCDQNSQYCSIYIK